MRQKNIKQEDAINEVLKRELEVIFNDILSSSKYKRLVINDRKNKINKIIASCSEYVAIIKKWMDKESVKNNENKLDRHKMAAAYFCAVLKVKPIDFNKEKMPNTPKTFREKNANEFCAFFFGLQILQIIVNGRAKTAKINDEEKIICSKPFEAPKVHNSTYTDWFIKLIEDMEKHFDNSKKKSFIEKLIFFISHIYFMIENYSNQYYRTELYKEEVNRLKRLNP